MTDHTRREYAVPIWDVFLSQTSHWLDRWLEPESGDVISRVLERIVLLLHVFTNKRSGSRLSDDVILTRIQTMIRVSIFYYSVKTLISTLTSLPPLLCLYRTFSLSLTSHNILYYDVTIFSTIMSLYRLLYRNYLFLL